MKISLLMFLCICTATCIGNDTLTRAQVYNLEIGDTFDYKHTTYNTQWNAHDNFFGFSRNVILDKYYLHDTLYIVGTNKTLIITDTGSMAYRGYTLDTNCNVSLQLYTNSVFNGRISNSYDHDCLDFRSYYNLAEGLGEVLNSVGTGNSLDGFSVYTTELVYYSKGNEKYGTPWEELAGTHIVHFTPLPEECAIWTNEITRTQSPNTGLNVQEQIRTGNKVPYNGKFYIEMLYTCFDYVNNRKTTDSLIGYFRNDTIGKCVWFVEFLGAQQRKLYDFNVLNGVKAGVGYITLDSMVINGQTRITWFYPIWLYHNVAYYSEKYIEGIGSINGLISVKFTLQSLNDYRSNLTCFSVCGQTLYPQAAAVNCAAITSIKDPANEEIDFTIYPTVADDVLIVNAAKNTGLTYLITATTGQVLATGNLNADGKIEVGVLPNGIYIVQLQGERLNTRGAKFVISR